MGAAAGNQGNCACTDEDRTAREAMEAVGDNQWDASPGIDEASECVHSPPPSRRIDPQLRGQQAAMGPEDSGGRRRGRGPAPTAPSLPRAPSPPESEVGAAVAPVRSAAGAEGRQEPRESSKSSVASKPSTLVSPEEPAEPRRRSHLLTTAPSAPFWSSRSEAAPPGPASYLATALRYLGFGPKEATLQELAGEALDLAFSLCSAQAPDVSAFVSALDKEDRRALHRLCGAARRLGLLGRAAAAVGVSTPMWELAGAFLSEAAAAAEGRAGAFGRGAVGDASSSSLNLGAEEEAAAGTRGSKTLGLPRRDLAGNLIRAPSQMSDISCTSFTDFNRRREGAPATARPFLKPSFHEFVSSLASQSSTSCGTVEGRANGGGASFEVNIVPPLGRALTASPLEMVSESARTYHSALDGAFGAEGDKAVVRGDRNQLRVAFRSQCLRTQNEWQRSLLAQQRVLLNMVSVKLQVAEKNAKAEDELHQEQRELLRGFRRIIRRDTVVDEAAQHVSVLVVEKSAGARRELERLCRILEYPCTTLGSLTLARAAVKERTSQEAPQRRSVSCCSNLSAPRAPGLLEGRPGQDAADWRSHAFRASKTGRLPTEGDAVHVVLLGAAWLEKELPPEWHEESVFVALTSQAEEYEEVGRTLQACGEGEIRDRLRERGIKDYLLLPLSLEGLRGLVGQAFQSCFGDEYLLLQPVGHGTSGVVHRAKRLSDGAAFALKEVNTKRLGKVARQDVEKEGQLLQELRWPTVLFCVDMWENRGDRLRYLLMPLVEGGNLQQRTDAAASQDGGGASRPDPGLVAGWYAQVLHGLAYLHWRGVLHRDLKPGNLLLGVDERLLVIGDLGSSALLEGAGPHPKRWDTIHGSVCSPIYAAPEVLLNETYCSGSDLWACGATFYEVVTLSPPFSPGTHLLQLQEDVLHFNVALAPRPAALTGSAALLPPWSDLPDLMHQDYLQRPSASRLVRRPAMLKRVKHVLKDVGALPNSREREAHLADFERVCRECEEADRMSPPTPTGGGSVT